MSAIIATLCGSTITPRKLNPATWFSQTWPLSTLYRPKFDILVASGAELQVLLSKGHLTSVQIVEECLKQIQNNDDYLSAVITLAPGIKTLALKRDQERRGDSTEGPLYGLPVLIKVRRRTILTASPVFTLAGQHRYGPRLGYEHHSRKPCTCKLSIIS